MQVQHTSTKDLYADFTSTDNWLNSTTHVYGSPFNITTKPAMTFARRSDISILNALDAWQVGQVHKLMITTRDAFGNFRQVERY